MKTQIIALLLFGSLFLLSSCASKTIVDTKGIDLEVYEQDLKECTALAEQLETGQTTAKSAAFGAALGAAFGLIRGDVAEAAAMGGVAGGASGMSKGDQEKSTVIKNCLRNRGYAVLN